MTSAALASGLDERVGLRTWATLGLLSALYFVSFVDRVILALLVQPLKAGLGVSDLQLGLLFGPAFAVFYALVGLPLARLADRGDRVRLIVVGAAVWGLCTVASGFVDSYLMLVMLRVGLAVGEGALTPAAYALIGAMFPPHQRVRAASLYSATGVAGGAASYIVGALVVQMVGLSGRTTLPGGLAFESWQMVFLVVGAPALLGALLVWAVAREPRREVPVTETLGAVWRHIGAHASMYIPLLLGAGVLQMANAAFAAWGPEHMRRDLGWSIREAGLAFGLSGLVGAVLGVLVIPAVGRAWQGRGRADAIPLMALVSATLGGLAAVAGPLSHGPSIFLACNAVAAFGLYGSSTGLVVAMQVIAPLEKRATLVAILILSITLFGQGLGPPAVALVGQAWRPGGAPALGVGLALVALFATVLGAGLLQAGRRPLAQYLSSAAGR